MKIQNYQQTQLQPVDMQGSAGCQVRWLIGAGDQAPNFAMRQFEVAPGGHTPKHSHPYEHEVFVLEGEGIILEGATEHRLSAGDVVFVRPDEVHQFQNRGEATLKFLCLVPNSSATLPITMAPECGVETVDG